jgi:hypothetical protein
MDMNETVFDADSKDLSGAEVYFIPDQSLNFSNGYLVTRNSSGHIELKYIYNYSGKAYQIYRHCCEYVGPVDDKIQSYDFHVIPGNGLLINNFNQSYTIHTPTYPPPSTQPSVMNGSILPISSPTPTPTASPTPTTTPKPTPPAMLSQPPGNKLIATSFLKANQTYTEDNLFILTKDYTGSFYETRVALPLFANNFYYFNFISSLPLPADIKSGFYYNDLERGTSYLSFYQDNSFRTLKWTHANPGFTYKFLSGIPHKIHSVLSNGDLFCIVNNMAYIYDNEGRKKFDFPLGKMHFAYELRTVPVPLMIFTLTRIQDGYWDGDWSDAFFIEVYSIPTSELQRLD